MPSLTRRSALLLNFTGNVYHWGCHGTSAEIYLSLAERDYQITWLDVRTTHALTPQPAGRDDFLSPEFVLEFFRLHPGIHHALEEADVVVVNGEGTLHGLHRAPMNLLFLMHLAANALGKPVHLINHSLFPNGDERPSAYADPLYADVARCLARVVPRDPLSRQVLSRLGVDATQGFDCLPRYLARHRIQGSTTPAGPLLLSGGVNMTDDIVARFAEAVRPHASAGRPLRFLAGAKSAPAPEDARIYAALRAHLPALEWFEAPTMESWLHAIGSAACLVSGRFHHTIAAATLGTPAVVFPSNTPKIPAMCAMFGIAPPIAYDDPDFVAKTSHAIDEALRGRAPLATPDALAAIQTCAAENFAGL